MDIFLCYSELYLLYLTRQSLCPILLCNGKLPEFRGQHQSSLLLLIFAFSNAKDPAAFYNSAQGFKKNTIIFIIMNSISAKQIPHEPLHPQLLTN